MMRRLALFGVMLALASCSREPSAQPVVTEPPVTEVPASYRLLSPDDAAKLIAATPDLVILDMRVEQEWTRDGRIKGAVFGNYLRANLEGWLSAQDRARPYLLYCALGERARLTAQIMHKLGFERVSILDGGLFAWIAAGKSVEE